MRLREFIAEAGHCNPRGTWTVGRPREVLTFSDWNRRSSLTAYRKELLGGNQYIRVAYYSTVIPYKRKPLSVNSGFRD